MKHSSISGISAAGKKDSPAAMARVLLVGLALLLPGMAALAIGTPIPGVDIIVKKNPGHDYPITVPTDKNGTYKFTGLAAGNYDLSVGGQRVQTITVGANQGISGVLSSEPGGKASITFNGQTDVVSIGPASAPVNPSRSNKKAGIVAGKAPPVVGLSTVAIGNETNTAMGSVSTTRGTAPGPGGGGVKPGIAEANSIALSQSNDKEGVVSPTRGAAPGPSGGGDQELPGKTGHAPKPVSPGTGPHGSLKAGEPLSEDVKPGIAESNGALSQVSTTRGTAPGPGGGDIKPGISDQGVIGNLSTYGTAPKPTSPGTGSHLSSKVADPIPGVDVRGTDAEKPGLAIQGIPIGLEGDPGSVTVSAQTDKTGAFQFTKLPAGKYKLTMTGQPSKSVTVGVDGGTISGKVMRNSDGTMGFDTGGSKAAESPVGFGSGNNAMGAGPGAGLGAGLGMSPPGAAMGGAGGPGPMSPMGPSPMGSGAGGPMGGSPGGAMRP